MNLTLISALLRTLATVAVVVDNGKKSEALSSTLNYAAKLVELGVAGEQKLQDLTADVQAMVDGTKTLTDADFDALKARSDDAHNAIQNS